MRNLAMTRKPLARRRASGALQRSAIFSATVLGAMFILPGPLFGQIREHRDRDDPPIEQSAEVPDAQLPDLSEVEQMIIDQTIAFRKEHGLGGLETNKPLTETAQYFADFMARTGKYGHTADGNRPSERADEHGYDYCLVSENIGYQFRSTGFAAGELAEKFVTGWKESPEHRENMLDADVMEIGVAVAQSEDSPTFFGVQMFGRPQSAAIAFQVANESEVAIEYTLRRQESDRTFPLEPRQRRRHARCRPTTLEFAQPETTLEVEDGAAYVVSQAPDGSLQVTDQPEQLSGER